MAVRIRLSDGSVLVVDADFQELHQKILGAIQGDLPLLEVKNGNGKMRSINPLQIVAIEEPDEESLTPVEEDVLEAVRDPQAPQPQ